MDATQAIAGPNALLRFLRASADPPSVGAPTKILVAASTWRYQAAGFPHLAEILRDWILGIWTDDDRSLASKGLLDADYHDLMLSVLNATRSELPTVALSRLFSVLHDQPACAHVAGHGVWELARNDSKSSADAWFDTWSAMLALLASSAPPHSIPRSLYVIVEAGIMQSLRAASIHKRVINALPSLVRNLSDAIGHGAALSPEVTGSVLFPLTALRTGGCMDSVLKFWEASDSSAVFVPHLMSSYYRAVRQNCYELYIQPAASRIPHDTYLNDKIRAAVRQEFNTCQRALSSLEKESSTSYWRQKGTCWECVADWGVYLASDEDWVKLLRTDAADAKTILAVRDDVRLLEVALMCLGTLEALDHQTTELDTNVFAWCIASPPQLFAHGQRILIESYRYHQVTSSEQAWISSVIDGIESLARSSLDQRSAVAVYRLISLGPLWQPDLLRALEATKRKDSILTQLLNRLSALSSTERTTASFVVYAISRLADAIFPQNCALFDDLVMAAEYALGQGVSTYAGRKGDLLQDDDVDDWDLASLLRLGRHASPLTKQRLEQVYELPSASALPNRSVESHRETILWVLDRLPEEPDQASRHLASLFELIGRPRHETASTSKALTPVDVLASDLGIIRELATPRQLQAVLAVMLLDSHYSKSLLNSADLIELTDIPTFLNDTVLALITAGQQLDRVHQLLLSWPQALIGSIIRAKLVTAWIQIDQSGGLDAKVKAREILGRLLAPGGIRLPSDFWAGLCEDLELEGLRASTIGLMARVLRGSLKDGQMTEIHNLPGRLLLAEIAMEEAFLRYDAVTREALTRHSVALVEELEEIGHTEAARTAFVFAHWCQAPNKDHLNFERLISPAAPQTPSAQFRVMLLSCSDDHDRLTCLEALLSSTTLYQGVDFVKEVERLASSFNDYRLLLSHCLDLTKRYRDAAIDAIAVILGIRKEGSGRAIRALRHELRQSLFRPDHNGYLTSPQIRGVRSLIRYRGKLLDLPDVARCLIELSSRRKADLIDIACDIVSSRPDLVVCLLPQVVALVQAHLNSISDRVAAPLTRLMKVLCGDQRQQRSRRAPLSLSMAMSKHAPAILAAYVRGLANPAAALSAEARRMLQASVYQVCDLVVRAQHREREGEGISQPYGVGEGSDVEKEIWADMWTRWNKQRYRGQG